MIKVHRSIGRQSFRPADERFKPLAQSRDLFNGRFFSAAVFWLDVNVHPFRQYHGIVQYHHPIAYVATISHICVLSPNIIATPESGVNPDPVNYFAHALPFIDRPCFMAGTAVPDWLRVADRAVRLRSKHVEMFCGDADPCVAEVAAGVLQHLRDDARFHETRTFAETSLELTVRAQRPGGRNRAAAQRSGPLAGRGVVGRRTDRRCSRPVDRVLPATG